MKLLFFDMEFANGQVPGSVYSFGYVLTDEELSILYGPSDILINPDAPFNEYVAERILAYPMEQVEAAPAFPALYEQIKALFDGADMAIGFSVNNDVRELKRDCARYGLEPIRYSYFDVERLCRLQEEHKEAHGLAGYCAAWCGEAPDNQHRSDGDALATMQLFRAVCRAKHVTPDMMIEAYPECVGTTVEQEKGGARSAGKQKTGAVNKRTRPRRAHRTRKIRQTSGGAEATLQIE